MGSWDEHHPDVEHIRHESTRDLAASRWEILFWFLVIVAHVAFMYFAARRLATRYTDATGGTLYVVDKREVKRTTGAAPAAARKRAGKGADLPE